MDMRSIFRHNTQAQISQIHAKGACKFGTGILKPPARPLIPLAYGYLPMDKGVGRGGTTKYGIFYSAGGFGSTARGLLAVWA
jgi:hypothetical protein